MMIKGEYSFNLFTLHENKGDAICEAQAMA